MTTLLLSTLLAYGASLDSPAVIDLATYQGDTFAAFTDGKGHYLVVDMPNTGKYFIANPNHPFYGDGKEFTEATTRGLNITTDDPRPPYGLKINRINDDDNKLNVVCGKRVTELTALPKAESDAMIAKAVFKRSRVEFGPYALARDDKGTYYYVDKGRYSENSDQFRVFVGQRGAMKEQKLTNIVHDSAGDIFATAKGDLRLITGDPARTEWWSNKNKSQLTNVPVSENIRLIFNDLGPYKNMRLGTPCDDM